MSMNAAEARALLFKRKLSMENVEWSIPGVPELDGQLATLELGANDTSHADKLAEGPNNETDEALLMAALVCKSLVLRDTKERLFSDTDMGMIDPITGVGSGVAGFGLSVLKPLSDLISKASCIGKYAIDITKKKLTDNPRERFKYFITREIGHGATKSELMDCISEAEITGWIAFYELEQEDREAERRRQEN